jgi:threonine aldolase
MVFFEVVNAELSNAEFLEAMLRAGVRMGQVRGQIRAVTHLDVSSDDIELTLSAAADIVTAGRAKVGGLDRVTSVGY